MSGLRLPTVGLLGYAALGSVLIWWGCAERHGEGYEPGGCTDRADNDSDGLFDCDDPDCAGSADCQAEPVDPLDACPPDATSSCLIEAELRLDPPDVEPGGTYTATVWIAHGDAENVQLTVDGAVQEPEVPLSAENGGLLGVVQLTATSVRGDHLVSVSGNHERGTIEGFALLNVTALGPCPKGQIREVGSCQSPQEGLPLVPESLFRTPYAPKITGQDHLEGDDDDSAGGAGTIAPVRMMLHPRRVFRRDDALVACLTDSVAVINIGTMFPVDQDQVEGEAQEPPNPMERAEGMLDVDGLAYCDDLAVDLDRGLAVATTRGALGQPAGLTSWRLPDLATPPFDDPQLLVTYEDAEGFEGAVMDGGFLYAAHKPNELSIFAIGDQGEIAAVSSTTLPGATGVWSVLKEGEIVYVTDAGIHPDRPEGEPQGGSLYVVDVSDPEAPQLLSSAPTHGLPKALASSGTGQLALAGGEAGFEIFDVSVPSLPELLIHEDTPGSAISIAWSEGYILLSDWNSIRLYDGAERGVLRQLFATDMSLISLSHPLPDPEWAMDNSGFIGLDGEDFIVTDMDTIILGKLHQGMRAPSANLVDRRWSLSLDGERDEHTFVFRFANGGRLPLSVEVRPDSNLESGSQPLL
ncbi:MAG: hypothetical protein CL928_09235, partial [Deltaproteobacteria bacterium]|nr:hypothetical protein [Deltaproteobacteria bacterium]